MPLQALIFDVDGTLADTERDGHRVAFNAAFAEHGLDWHWDEALYGELLQVAGGVERMAHYAQRHRGLGLADDDLAALLKRLHASKTRHYVQRVAAGAVRLRPGIERLIREARREGLRLAIATTTTRDNVIALLQATLGADAPGWFDVMGTAQEVTAKKPDPAVYRWVLERLRLPAEAALAFEDSGHGVTAATTAGVRCVVTPTAYSAGDDLGAAAVRLADLDHHPDDPARTVTLDDLRRWHAAAPCPLARVATPGSA
ncbi:HAD-IA family hydrolase [Azohydromonas sediminis]|uniref:HAD-IA family hydrolase n=1 Tax=Azohydromonas sediminis TaxID=2259674 RepID=UPI000E64B291|nr:HAD-IA family hydrolase [Azohydromonas sediminis]